MPALSLSYVTPSKEIDNRRMGTNHVATVCILVFMITGVFSSQMQKQNRDDCFFCSNVQFSCLMVIL